MSDLRGREVNRAELAEISGKSLPTIDAWISKGCPFLERGGKGREWRFDTAEVLDWRERLARDGASPDPSPGTLDPVQERARKDRALAIQTEMKNDVAQGQVVIIEDVITQLTQMLTTVRSQFLGLPSKARSRHDPSKPETLFFVLQDLVNEILTNLSDPEKFEAIQDAERKQRLAARRSDPAPSRGENSRMPEGERAAASGPEGRGGRPRAPGGKRGGGADRPKARRDP